MLLFFKLIKFNLIFFVLNFLFLFKITFWVVVINYCIFFIIEKNWYGFWISWKCYVDEFWDNMFKFVIYNINFVKLCIVNLYLLRIKSFKFICYKGNIVMYFIVIKNYL